MNLWTTIKGGVDFSGVAEVIHFIKELAGGANDVGPPSPPPWLQPLLDGVGEAESIPPMLLGALSCVLAGYDPAHPRGIVGAGGELHPTVAELAARAPVAVAMLQRDVQAGAALLRQLRDEHGDWCAALARYTAAAIAADGGVPGYPRVRFTVVRTTAAGDGRIRDAGSVAAEVFGAFMIFTLRHAKGAL